MRPELKPCPLCGSSAEMDFGASVEIDGWAWQTASVECKDDHDKKCRVSLSFECDFSGVQFPGNTGDTLVDAWNALPREEEAA